MQVPATSSASQAASIVAQASSKDSGAEAHPAHAAGSQAATQSAVEKTSSANADRDAQGQSDGLPNGHKAKIVDELEIESEDSLNPESLAAPLLPDEPPSQLDIIG